LTMLALPYLVVVGLSLTELSISGAKMLLRCTILGWAITAGGLSLIETDKDLRWQEIAKAIALHDPVPVYATEAFVRIPLEYHFTHSAATAITVQEQPDLGKIPDDRFWFVYRDISWRGPAPELRLSALGDYLEEQLTMQSERRGREHQKITALLVRTAKTD